MVRIMLAEAQKTERLVDDVDKFDMHRTVLAASTS